MLIQNLEFIFCFRNDIGICELSNTDATQVNITHSDQRTRNANANKFKPTHDATENIWLQKMEKKCK